LTGTSGNRDKTAILIAGKIENGEFHSSLNTVSEAFQFSLIISSLQQLGSCDEVHLHMSVTD
jgi:hypothetical protein